MKTIKQIADELGIPKHKVKYQADKLPKNYVEKIGEILQVTPEGEAVLLDLLAEKTAEKTGEFSDEILRRLVVMLEQELEAKNRQITDLSAALAAALQTAAAAQALHAGTMKNLPDAENTKPGFFARLFRRERRDG